MYDRYGQTNFLWGALVGGAVATLTTLLFTTKKGKQLQDQIAGAYNDAEESIKSAYKGAEETVKGAYNASKDKVEEALDRVQKKMAPNQDERSGSNQDDRLRAKHEEAHKASK